MESFWGGFEKRAFLGAVKGLAGKVMQKAQPHVQAARQAGQKAFSAMPQGAQAAVRKAGTIAKKPAAVALGAGYVGGRMAAPSAETRVNEPIG